jgi:hypothetical protein
MNLFQWLFRSPRFQREPDAFTAHREQLWSQILKAIRYQQGQGNVVWIVTHFADQFSEMQRRLGQWQQDYEIVMNRIDTATMVEMSRQKSQVVFLALAELLSPAETVDREIDNSILLSMIAIERHPMIDFDSLLETVATQIPSRVKFGYYLALDDPVFGSIGQSVLVTLRQLGLKDDELISSYATSRSIQRIQKTRSANYDRTLRADSAMEWIALQEGRSGK